MKRLRIICLAAILVLVANGIARERPPFTYWGVHLLQNISSDGGIRYEFDAYASSSGTVTTPPGEILPLGEYEEPSLAALLARFPDGIYTFDDGDGGIYEAELSGPFPGEFPNITFYAFNLAGDLVINWDPWLLGKSNPVICVMMDDSDYYVELDSGATGHVISASEIPSSNPLSGTVQFKNRVIEPIDHGDKIKGSSFIMFSGSGPPVSGLIWMPEVPGEGYAIGYSLDEMDWLYFFSYETTWSYNIATGEWVPYRPVGWIYIDWPFYYILDSGYLMLAIPPASGLWVYHFSTSEWTVLPRIIP
ncbi:MAG: hypothetical protein ACYS6K_19595 [Planctomycetota bacterium]|jgi:hypothetical protein